VRYVMAHEWARSAEDVIWRRSKLGLRLSDREIERLAGWMATQNAAGTHEPV
jgi:glycerol-3-phosphate dehydrogenase